MTCGKTIYEVEKKNEITPDMIESGFDEAFAFNQFCEHSSVYVID